MKEFKVGFSRCDITPPIGAGLVGYLGKRPSTGVLDPLLASVLAVSDEDKTLLIVSLDTIGVDQVATARIKEVLRERTGIPADRVFLHATHIHTGPALSYRYAEEFNEEYFLSTADAIASAAEAAMLDLAPAKVYVNAANTPVEISFIRRFRMKDGTTRTNPGFLNPDIDHPLGEADHRVALTLFKREGKPEIALINFQVHPDVMGGLLISADYPGFTRRTYEAAMPNSVCMYINGTQGDTNHLNVKTPEGLPRSRYDFAQHMGRTLAGTAMALHAMAEPIDPLPLATALCVVRTPQNKAESEEEIAWATKIKRLHDEGKDREFCPEGGMAMVTLVAKAKRILSLVGAPDEKELHVTGLRMGEFALVGFPGEPFTEIGRRAKEASPAKMTFAACCANGYEGYYPTRSAFEEGGYEAGTSPYRSGVGEAVLGGAKAVLAELFGE